QTMLAAITRGSIYLRASYDLTPTTEIFADVTEGEVRTQNQPGQPPRSGLTIRCDNAYLPSTGIFGIGLTEAQTQAACLSSYPGNAIQYGTLNANLPIGHREFIQRALRRYVVGGNGVFDLFGKNWRWDSYFQHGESGSGVRVQNEPLKNAFNLALDAVQTPGGQIVCRSTVAQANGCVPFNSFG